MPPRGGEVGPPFLAMSYGKPLSGVPCHGLLWKRCPAMGGAHDGDAQAIS
jgi:hypothetical protein